MSGDPLASIERVVIFELAAANIRHDLRNRFGTVRNAAFFLEKRCKGAEVWTSDPRVPRFFALIEEEIVAADMLLATQLPARQPPPVESATTLAQIVDLALANLRVAHSAPPTIDVAELRVAVDRDEMAVGVRALIENAIEAGGAVALRSRDEPTTAQLEIDDHGPGMDDAAFTRAAAPRFTTKEGRAGLGLPIADRLARRWGGTLRNVASDGGARLVLELPKVTP